MKMKITEKITVSTAPYNWIIRENGKEPWYEDNLEGVIRYLTLLVSGKDLSSLVGDARALLNLSKEDSLSAYDLTKKIHHPDFTKKVSPKSLENLKSKPILSAKNEDLPKIRARP